MDKYNHHSLPVDDAGFYGRFGGAFIPEVLRGSINSLMEAYYKYVDTEEFQTEFRQLLRDYVGRPSPLYFSPYLSKKYGAKIYLKREDLNHTGAHKINNTIGQILLARKMGKTRVLAETGAGQHGVATATVCALMNMECRVFMGATDIARQRPNVERMKMLGAEVVAAESGNKTLKDATNEAISTWCSDPDSYYLIGSAVGPHPYPEMVSYFQSVISEEIAAQLKEREGREEPDYVIACIGGGSNAAGAFYHFLDKPEVKLVAVEAGGHGVDSGETAATITIGTEGVIHGSRTLVMQTENGEVVEPYSISAGLDYPGIGPLQAYLAKEGRTTVLSATDDEALAAAYTLTRHEGIIPALESAHALAGLEKITFKPDDVVVVNVSGRGDKDLLAYITNLPE